MCSLGQPVRSITPNERTPPRLALRENIYICKYYEIPCKKRKKKKKERENWLDSNKTRGKEDARRDIMNEGDPVVKRLDISERPCFFFFFFNRNVLSEGYELNEILYFFLVQGF